MMKLPWKGYKYVAKFNRFIVYLFTGNRTA